MIQAQQQVFRPQPKMAITAYKTYAVRVPRSTHTERISCTAAECDQHRDGWRTVLDTAEAAQLQLARWIRDECRRSFSWSMAGTVVTFDFPAGQTCFREHRRQIRPGLYVVRDGDYRGNPSGWKATMTERAWVDDFGEHQQTLADEQKKG
jgi:hypothetical protein